jgi:hypothetical protein
MADMLRLVFQSTETFANNVQVASGEMQGDSVMFLEFWPYLLQRVKKRLPLPHVTRYYVRAVLARSVLMAR